MTSSAPDQVTTITALRQIISSISGAPHHDEHGSLDGVTTATATITAQPTASGSVALTVENDDGEATLNIDGLNPHAPADEATQKALAGFAAAFLRNATGTLARLCQGDDR